MLPTKGYFQDIECPYYDNVCNRPFCHFRHRKKGPEPTEDPAAVVVAAPAPIVHEIEEKEPEVPIYKPTPKSQLANKTRHHHIPISYVPDLAYRQNRTNRAVPRFPVNVVYKPTPISVLSSAGSLDDRTVQDLGKVTSDFKAVLEVRQNEPTEVQQEQQEPLVDDIDFEDLSEEFNLIDDIIDDSSTTAQVQPQIVSTDDENCVDQTEPEVPEAIDKEAEAIAEDDSVSNKEHILELTEESKTEVDSDLIQKLETKSDSKKTETKSDSKKSELKSDSKKSEIKSDNKKTEAKSDKKKSEVRSDSKKSETKSDSSRKSETKSDSCKKSESKSDSSKKSENKSDSSKKSETKHDSSKKSETKSDSSKKSEAKSDSKRSDEKSNTKKSRSHTDSRKTESKSDSKNSESKSDSRKSESRGDSKKSEARRDSRKSSTKSDSKKSKSKDRTRDRSRSRTKDKNHVSKHRRKHDSSSSSTERSRSSSSDRDSRRHHDKKKHSHKSEHKHRHSSSERSKHKDNHKNRDHHSDHRKKERDKKNSNHKKSSKEKSKTENRKSVELAHQSSDESSSKSSVSDNDIYMDTTDINLDLEENLSDIELEDKETLMECYKIFNEYKAPEKRETNPEPLPADPLDEMLQEATSATTTTKKRIAHRQSGDGATHCDITRPAYVKPKSQPAPALIMTNRLKLAREAQQLRDPHMVEDRKLAAAPAVKRPAPSPSVVEAVRNLKMMKRSASPKAPVKTQAQSTNLIDSIINGQKPKVFKIAPAQNVMSIQRAKARIDEMARQKAIDALNKTPVQVQKGPRVAHVPTVSLADIPDVLQADKSKLPVNVRTRFLTLIADECVKLYASREDAYNRALNEEYGCYEKCNALITYKNSSMLAVSRLRRELQERFRLGLGPLTLLEASTTNKPSELSGRQFYERIKKFVLTDEELDLHGYPRESAIHGHAVIKNVRTKPEGNLAANQRKCARCRKIYLVDKRGFVLNEEECIYHPLKKRTLRGEQTYLCCKSNDDTGCTTSHTHVSEMADGAELEGYQTTMKPKKDDDPRSFTVYALDCEMCYTVKGLELTRVTVVDADCKTVYETLVKPLNPIIDYNTTFSGITREQMEKTSTSILQVQANILHLCNSNTILIGHSLESDMKALKIIHRTVIDTSVLFPHKMGLPHKRALRVLASEFLNKIIQNSVSGHDSAEDAITCMELVKWKIKEELKVKGIK